MTDKIAYITMFSTSSCPNCIPMKATLEVMRERFGQQVDIQYREVDTNTRHMQLAREWHVSAVPTTVLIVDGEEKAKIIGNHPVNKIGEIIEGCLQRDILQESSGRERASSSIVLRDSGQQENDGERSS